MQVKDKQPITSCVLCRLHFLPSLSSFLLHGCLFPQAVEVIAKDSGSHQDARLLSQRTEAFLSLARFSDMQYQIIDKYMKSSEFENKQALLKKAKEEVGLIREHKFVNRSAETPSRMCVCVCVCQ